MVVMEPSRELAKQCDDCNVALVGPFCHRCGQRDIDHLASVRVFLAHFLEVLFGFDSRLVRTARGLFLRPGLLTAEYVAGRRIRYLPPLQLYLIGATLLFVSASFNPMVTFTPSTNLIRSGLPTLSFTDRLHDDQIARLAANGTSLELFAERFGNATTAHLSTVLVVTVPLLILATAIVFLGTGRPLGQHVVFVLH